MTADSPDLLEALLAGDHRALARVISHIEDRTGDHRSLCGALYRHRGDADVIGVTGSPGAGKSTLVDKVAAAYRDRGETVGVIAIDPSSPYTGGSVLGDRIRMASNSTDMDVFFRSMSTRGSLGGLSTATDDAVAALDAFGKDKIIVETVGAGQNEVDIVRTADTVAVLVPPGSGDDVQMLKAGILEIADCFVVNKADLDGADRTVSQLREMVERGRDDSGEDGNEAAWDPPIIETVATEGDGVEGFLDAIDDHLAHLDETGERAARRRERYRATVERLLRTEIGAIVEADVVEGAGLDAAVSRIVAEESDPYAEVEALLEPVRAGFEDAE
jgi:LAO/AO transport system kinase